MLLARHAEGTAGNQPSMHVAIVRAESGGVAENPIGTPFANVLYLVYISTRVTLLGSQAPVALKRLVLFWLAHHHHPSHICLSESVVRLAARGRLTRRASKFHHPAISPEPVRLACGRDLRVVRVSS